MKKSGYALATVLVLLGVCLFGVGVLVSISTLESKISRSQQEGVKAYYVAEAGLEDALWRLNHVPELRTALEGGVLNSTYTADNQPDPDQSFTVSMESTAANYADISVQGNSDNGDFVAQRKINASVFMGNATNDSPELALMSGGEVTITNGSSQVQLLGGDLYAGDGITLNNATVDLGSDIFRTPGQYYVNNSTVVSGGIEAENYQPAAPEYEVPGIDFSYYAANNNANYTANQFKNLVQNAPGKVLNLPGPVTYVSGGINMAGWAKNTTINITGMLIFDGNFTVNHAAVTNFAVNIADPGDGKSGLFTSGNMNNGNGTWNVDGVMYAAGDMRYVNAREININGGIIAGGDLDITTGLDLQVQYVVARALPVFGEGDTPTVVQVQHWEEEY